MVDFMNDKMENAAAFERHKERRIQEMHERFITYKLNKKKETKSYRLRLQKGL